MTPYETIKNNALKGDKKDTLLLYVVALQGVTAQAQKITGNGKRGDLWELTRSHALKVKRDGLHNVSNGDYITATGEAREVKYITPKTGAHYAKTTAKYYEIGFNDGRTIEVRLIKPNEIIAKEGRITFKENHELGTLIERYEIK